MEVISSLLRRDFAEEVMKKIVITVRIELILENFMVDLSRWDSNLNITDHDEE